MPNHLQNETSPYLLQHTDLPDLLSSLEYTLKRIGSYYTTAEMDSIRIKECLTWRRYSTWQSDDAITFLQKFCGMRFAEAVDHLLAFHVSAPVIKLKKRRGKIAVLRRR